jgi:hypothetical protein
VALGGREMRLERDVDERDHYGRILAYVYVRELMVNAESRSIPWAGGSSLPCGVA